jgi:hypothetical protein
VQAGKANKLSKASAASGEKINAYNVQHYRPLLPVSNLKAIV